MLSSRGEGGEEGKGREGKGVEGRRKGRAMRVGRGHPQIFTWTDAPDLRIIKCQTL